MSTADTARGIGLAVAAFCIYPIADGMAKLLVHDYHVVQLTWGRLFFQTIVVLVGVAASGQLRAYRAARPAFLSVTVLGSWLANFPMFLALAYLPLADVFAIVLTMPLLVTALSVPLLGERVGHHRWVAVFVGFSGALVVIRPGMSVFHWAALLPLVSALCFALYQLGVRKLSERDGPVTIVLYASVLPLVLTSVMVPFVWRAPTDVAWLQLAAIGGFAGIAHFCLIAALRHAEASLIAPLTYVQMASSSLFGFLLFGDLPGTHTIVGASVVVGAGLYVAQRERAQAQPRAT